MSGSRRQVQSLVVLPVRCSNYNGPCSQHWRAVVVCALVCAHKQARSWSYSCNSVQQTGHRHAPLSSLPPQTRPIRIAEAIERPPAPRKREDDVGRRDRLAAARLHHRQDVLDDLSKSISCRSWRYKEEDSRLPNASSIASSAPGRCCLRYS